MFHPVSSKVNFPQLEENILKLWRSKDVFGRSIEARRGGRRFVFYEGPPTANGSPGIHHVLARVFKDIIPRYKAMKGYYTQRMAGWDTHGLPIELEVERELGFSSKTEIEEYGIDRFNARCRESVFSYLKEWEAMTERIAYWVDLKHPYITMDNNYIETCWWAIKGMWDRGLIYQGYKVTPHCPRCGTSLSSHEVALGYQDTDDPSVYIKFKVVKASLVGSEVRDRLFNLFISSDRPAYFLAWTTTPWTLPGNTALAVDAEAEYAVVEVDDEYLILASALLERVGLTDYKVVEKLKGSDLVGGGGKEGIEYEPLYNPHEFGVERRRFETVYNSATGQWRIELPVQEAPKPPVLGGPSLTYKVIDTDFVSMEEGTGIVHMAPAYGEVDYEAGVENGLDFIHPVDLQGKVIGTYPFAGKFVKEADHLILDELRSRGLLFRSETIRHTYPFCWRCEMPLLYYAKQTWYIRTTAVKDDLIARNNEVNWYPEHIKYGRFGDWLENNVDWAFSRERYWGTPLPIWQCESCGEYECVGGVGELEGRAGFSGFKQPLDLHRPFVDELTFACSKCGATMRRVPEVIDCWFDSGAMPVGQWHYPFENDTLLEDGRFPADYISEAVDQTRGWFYSLHAISTLLFNRRCFSNVICLGHILDARGEKMSKAKGNVIEPWMVIDKYGADALRWYFFTATPPGNVRRFSEDMVAEVTRRFLLTLWNVYSFFVTYANIDRFTPGSEGVSVEQSELDRWIISELNQLIADVDAGLDAYNPTEAGRKIESFVNDLSNWYVRRSRRRFWKSESDADKLAAYTTLYECLVTLSKLLAPFTPFVAEELYQNLVCSAFPEAPDSVHLADFPVANEAKIDRQLAADTRLVMKVSSLGRAARSQAGIKVRQPLAKVMVKVESSKERESLERLMPQALEELNVKGMEFVDDVAGLDKPGLVASQEGAYGVAVPTEISPELAAEGVAREIVRRLQAMRRSADFNIADHIITYYHGEAYIRQVMEDFADYIKQETLSQQLIEGVPKQDVFTESYKLSGYDILLGVSRIELT
ncbi:MAG: isoleucine--tRNA ligase [Dehalococcoidia bacterium]|nr:isoleucine--tRNA ligase [Dehalococcoidia bacterium]